MWEYRKVYCFENGQSYNGYSEAAKSLGLNNQCVYKCCIGDQIQTKGFHFCYEDERDIYEMRISRREKPIIAIHLKSGRSVHYSSVKEAVQELDISPNTLYSILSKRVKKPRIGYSFKYAVQ